MKINSEPFGNIEVDDSDALHFPEAVVGFPAERTFALRRHREGSPNLHAIMAVLCAPAGRRVTVNLLAPINVDAATRIRAQVSLEEEAFSTTERFVLCEHQAPRPAEATVFASPAASAP